MKMNKRKLLAAILAAMLAAGVVLSGTFAWQSLNQTAKNELSGNPANPGGRLHDDFNGKTVTAGTPLNKDIYVENFGDQPIFARIRLFEYMETGEGAGQTTGTKKATSLVTTANGITNQAPTFRDEKTWTIHKPGANGINDCGHAFHTHWEWDLNGGNTVYMPTFNTNKDDEKADINGTYAQQFTDYETYQVNQQKTKDGVTHTADNTATATRAITMTEWQALTDDQKQGDYWVYDTDGWAYYAKPIPPASASGLLLTGITPTADLEKQFGKDWYYGINVQAQFATAGDWGDKNAQTGFYQAGDGMTDDALALLNKISNVTTTTRQTVPVNKTPEPVKEIKINVALDTPTVYPGDNLTFTAQVPTGQSVAWSVQGADRPDTAIDDKGNLTIAADETAQNLTVIAESEDGNSDSYTLDIQGKE